jgi:hypothetical protein
MGVQLHVYLTLELDADEWGTSCPCHSTSLREKLMVSIERVRHKSDLEVEVTQPID